MPCGGGEKKEKKMKELSLKPKNWKLTLGSLIMNIALNLN